MCTKNVSMYYQQVNIPGVPGEDYPIYAEVPDTGFTCDGLVEGGYYADPAAECQAFHICANDGAGGLITYRWGLKYFEKLASEQNKIL